MVPSALAQQVASAAPSISIALAPVVLGGVLAYFKLFIGSRDDLRKQISLLREKHIEKSAVQLTRLLKHAALNAGGVLRGDGREEPDLVGDYEAEAFRRATVFHRLERVRLMVKIGFDLLFLTIALGVVAAILATLLEPARPYATGGGVALIVLQLLIVAVVYYCGRVVESLEETA